MGSVCWYWRRSLAIDMPVCLWALAATEASLRVGARSWPLRIRNHEAFCRRLLGGQQPCHSFSLCLVRIVGVTTGRAPGMSIA